MDDAVREVAGIRQRLAELDAMLSQPVPAPPDMNARIRGAAGRELRSADGADAAPQAGQAAVLAAATARGFHEPELAVRLLAGEDVGDAGAAVDALAAAHPYLIAVGPPAAESTGINAALRAAAGRERA